MIHLEVASEAVFPAHSATVCPLELYTVHMRHMVHLATICMDNSVAHSEIVGLSAAVCGALRHPRL